ncbi:hypothetical protein N180_01750 [Pedobacter antarcticus 4BY]|uniref:DUF4062 domain-containing protein n=2 Tax=Pedobacter antarcticus TaxID=34086 RepID=A0A081PCF9_9SPHI|nr:hypothetical protein N180_01750 [Pedobacter antarcticus 4BY]
MAKPRVFISSTFYDLKQTRADLDLFLDQLGYEPVRNEEGDIPYGKEDALEEYCYKEIKSIDILISIVGGRFGSESKKHDSSVSQMEIRAALAENKQIYLFIDKNVLSEYETYLLNKDSDIKYRYVDDQRIYNFIEEIKSLKANNNIKGFDTVSDITKYLKEQLAGLFQRFLQEQTRVKEINLIKGLEKTAQTLNRLVNYLSDENKDQAEEINRILMISHPLTESVKSDLGIKYNFYIEGFDDLKAFMIAYGYTIDDDEPLFGPYLFVRTFNNNIYKLIVSTEIFDDEKKLKFFKKNDWNTNWSIYTVEAIVYSDEDDLPF